MFIVGTAGHVDHGKSSLVKALTGTHPDRLKEEQDRGMTLDLGYAWTQIEEAVISFVDVPGHRDFLENMLIGVHEVHGALLVVDVNEGLMPQTIEHGHILSLLGIQHGVVALTKLDSVEDTDWLALIESDVLNLLHQAGLPIFPIVPTSIVNGQGIPELKAHLLDMARHYSPIEKITPLRLPIDRVFNLKGHGTVVTGTLQGEALPNGAEVVISPSGLVARIRQLQSHNQAVSVGHVGDRLAVNLANVDQSQVRRGDVLTYQHGIQASKLWDVAYQHLAHAPRALKHGEEVRIFVGTSKLIATIHAPHLGLIHPSEHGCFQLQLRQMGVVLRGDRFILRSLSPSETLGGGVIIDPLPSVPYRKRDVKRWEQLLQVAHAPDSEWIWSLLEGGSPCTFAELTMRTNCHPDELTRYLNNLMDTGHIHRIGKDRYWTTTHLQELAQRVIDRIATFLKENPHQIGMTLQQLVSVLDVDSEMIEDALHLTDSGIIQMDEGWLTLATHQPSVSVELRQLTDQVLGWLNHEPFSPPDLDRLMAMGLTRNALTYLINHHIVVLIAHNLILSATAYASLIEHLNQLAQIQSTFTVADVRDRLQTSRKYAVAYLEHLDKAGITLRKGDTRMMRSR